MTVVVAFRTADEHSAHSFLLLKVQHLRDIGFRSLDFSELALRVEDEIDEELNFEAAGLRQIATVGDVLNLLTEIQDQ